MAGEIFNANDSGSNPIINFGTIYGSVVGKIFKIGSGIGAIMNIIPAGGDRILREDGSFLLREDGGFFLRES